MPSSQSCGLCQSGHQRRRGAAARRRRFGERGAATMIEQGRDEARHRPRPADRAASCRRPAAAPAEWSARGRARTRSACRWWRPRWRARRGVGAQSADQRRKRRLEDRDAEAHQQRRGIKRPDVERRGAARRRRASRSASPQVAIASTPKRAISSEPGIAASANMLQRQAHQQADLRLGHVQVVVNQRDNRRHREQRNPDRGAGEPEQREHRE